jgi:hypothetical protein
MTASERHRRWRAGVREKRAAEKMAAVNAHLERCVQIAVATAVERLQVLLDKSLTQAKEAMDGWKETQRWAEFHIRRLQDELALERDRHEAPIDPNDLSKHHRAKFEYARQRQDREYEERVKQQDSEFEDRVKQAVRKVLDALHGEAGQNGPPVTETGYRDLVPCEETSEYSARSD